MKIILLIAVIMFLSLIPLFISKYEDYRDIKKIEEIKWNISVGGSGVYTSMDKKYKLTVAHPYPPTIGDEGDEDGYFYFQYHGGSNFIEHPPAETMQIFKKR